MISLIKKYYYYLCLYMCVCCVCVRGTETENGTEMHSMRQSMVVRRLLSGSQLCPSIVRSGDKTDLFGFWNTSFDPLSHLTVSEFF